jgi:hypothetical protein
MALRSIRSIHVDHPIQARVVHNWSSALLSRNRSIGSTDGIEEVVNMTRAALHATPVRQSRICLSDSLADALYTRMCKTRSVDNAREGVNLLEEALSMTPRTSAAYRQILGSLAEHLLGRFKLFGDMFLGDLDRAIETCEEVLSLTPRDDPSYALSLVHLSKVLQSRFDRLKQATDLDRAISTSEEALNLIPIDQPGRAHCLVRVGWCYWSQFRLGEAREWKERAISAMECAIDVVSAEPFVRAQAGFYIGLMNFDDHRRASHPLKVAVELLPFISPRTLSRADQQARLSLLVGLASLAASACLESDGTPYQALQLLEIGRGVMASYHLDISSDITLLKECYPDRAQLFWHVREQLNATLRVGVGAPGLAPQMMEDRYTICKEFDSLLDSIRQLKGFEQFLRGPSEVQLRDLAVTGPIVILKASHWRSDAFLVTRDEIKCLPLPQLRHSDLERYAHQFLEAVENVHLSSFSKAIYKLKEVLEWLWDVAVGLILEELSFTTAPKENEPWPRVWWVGEGLFNVLPIHAAGYHDLEDSRTVIDRVVSSYSATLKTLAFSREMEMKSSSSTVSQKALLIGMPTTPDQSDLPCVDTELCSLQELLPTSISTIVVRNPTREKVSLLLPHQNVVHLSCHGIVSRVDPSQSSFLLEDWKSTPLSVADIISLKIRCPIFAFLSTCHSAATRKLDLLDESINLSSSFQLAGFPAVVGTLWQVTDLHSANVAKDVYQWMLDGKKLNIKRFGRGLTPCRPAFERSKYPYFRLFQTRHEQSAYLGSIYSFRSLRCT